MIIASRTKIIEPYELGYITRDISDTILDMEMRGIRPNKIYLSKYLYNYLDTHDMFTQEYRPYCDPLITLCGLEIVINKNYEKYRFMIVKEENMKRNDDAIDSLRYCCLGGRGAGKTLASNKWFEPVAKLPKRYIINKGATILFWGDNTKTIIKRAKDDEYDKVKAFLWAYFLKTSGLTRTKANKYLAELVDEVGNESR